MAKKGEKSEGEGGKEGKEEASAKWVGASNGGNGVKLRVLCGGSYKWPRTVRWLLLALGDAAWRIPEKEEEELKSGQNDVTRRAEELFAVCEQSKGDNKHECEVCAWKGMRGEWEKVEKRAAIALSAITSKESQMKMEREKKGEEEEKGKVSGTMAVSEAAFLVSECFARVLLTAKATQDIPRPIDLIGSHGQTVWHHQSPATLIPCHSSFRSSSNLHSSSSSSNSSLGRISSTLQIGDGSVLAARMEGATVVSNFRTADVAFGGQGAPLTSSLDLFLLESLGNTLISDMNASSQHSCKVPIESSLNSSSSSSNFSKHIQKPIIALQNLGGMGNVTILPPRMTGEDGKEISSISRAIAFDTGPANVLLDWFVGSYFGQAYDAEGKLAKAGRVSKSFLLSFLLHPYFSLPIPKTCGREVFTAQLGETWWQQAQKEGFNEENEEKRGEEPLSSSPFTPQDFVATLTDLTALSLILSYLRFTPSILVEREEKEKEKETPLPPFPSHIYISGGGSHNDHMLERIRYYAKKACKGELGEWEEKVFGDSSRSSFLSSLPLPLPSPLVLSHDLTGIDADLKESVLFSLLAFMTSQGIPSSVPSCTGASRSSVLGSISPGSNFLSLFSPIKR